MAKRGTISAVDRVTPALHRVRYHFLTPIGHRIPPRGTYARSMLELQVAIRRAGRDLWAALPGGRSVPYDEAGRTLYRWLVVIGLAYVTVLGGLLLLHAFGAIGH